MNPKIFFGLLFGLPTILMVYIYHDLGINNMWQLFLFGLGVIFGYMPGVIMIYMFQFRNSAQKTLLYFIDSRE